MPQDAAIQYLNGVLLPLCHVNSSAELYDRALSLHCRLRYSPYDALIIAAAQHAGCETLYSEDLQHGHVIEQLTILNPFI
ncbi:PIN domain-containing protein [Endothiovibrio diazotrophicus]